MKSSSMYLILLRYGIALISVGAAALLTRWLSGLGDSGISPQFFAAVVLSAWVGGLGPGLFATFLSGIATGYLLLHPHGKSLAFLREDILRVLVFSVVAVLTSSLHAATQRAAREAHRARLAAESASAAKSRFLAMVSHELRTPLGPIVMISEMLADDASLPDRVRKDMKTIRQHVSLEIRLIEDLLDLARLGSGKMNLHLEPVDIHDPLQTAVQVCEPEAHDKGLEIVLDLWRNPLIMNGDVVRLQQVFWNLLRNAIKFSNRGGKITVRTGLSQTGSASRDGERIVVQVNDSGIGIDPTRLPAIFEAFEQADRDAAARFGGLGLGLAICLALVEAHGGHISAASAGAGQGATFTVTFPRLSDDIAATAVQNSLRTDASEASAAARAEAHS